MVWLWMRRRISSSYSSHASNSFKSRNTTSAATFRLNCNRASVSGSGEDDDDDDEDDELLWP